VCCRSSRPFAACPPAIAPQSSLGQKYAVAPSYFGPIVGGDACLGVQFSNSLVPGNGVRAENDP